MIRQNYSLKIQSLLEKLKEIHQRKTTMANQQSQIFKINSLRDLRQIPQKQIIEGGIFSQKYIETNLKLQKIRRTVKKEEVLIQRVRECNSNKKQSSKKIIRRLSKYEVNSINSSQNIISPFQAKNRITFLEILQQKSIFSTKENSEKSERGNIQIEEIYDESPIKKQTKQQTKWMKNLNIQDFEILNLCRQKIHESVFVARDKKTNCLCVLRRILKDSLKINLDKQTLIQQIKINRRISHPNIVKFYGCFSNSTEIYFVFQFCQQRSLYQILNKCGTFEQKKVRKIIYQVCIGINYLHNQNIIHQNIKAENIIFQDKMVKICDFSRAKEGYYSGQSLCRYPDQISFEVIQYKLYEKKKDVQSLGILTYELVYGRIPFQMKQEIIINEGLFFPQKIKISQCCKDFILKCLQNDSFKQWDTSRLLTHPFLKRL